MLGEHYLRSILTELMRTHDASTTHQFQESHSMVVEWLLFSWRITMSKFFNDLGKLTDERINLTAIKISRLTDNLMRDLFADGLTIVEGYAIGSHLQGQVETEVIIAILDRRSELAEKKSRKVKNSGRPKRPSSKSKWPKQFVD
jgi:hypothetical protein